MKSTEKTLLRTSAAALLLVGAWSAACGPTKPPCDAAGCDDGAVPDAGTTLGPDAGEQDPGADAGLPNNGPDGGRVDGSPDAGGAPDAGGTTEVPDAGGTTEVPDAGGTTEVPDAGGGETADAGSPAPDGETCRTARPLVFNASGFAAVNETTAGTRSDVDQASACFVSAATGGDVFYEFTLAHAASLSVSVGASPGYRPMLYLRTADCAGTIACAVADVGAQGTTLTVPVLQAGRYVLAVDGANGTAGGFALTAQLGPGPTTQYAEFPAETCHAAIRLDLDRGPVTTTGDTTTAYDDGPDWSCTGGRSHDLVYSVYAHADGTLRATVTPTGWDAALGLSRPNCSSPIEIRCSDEYVSLPETLSMPVSAGETYVLYVTGTDLGARGPYSLTVSLE